MEGTEVCGWRPGVGVRQVFDNCAPVRSHAICREEDLSKNKRIKIVLREVRKRAGIDAGTAGHVHIISENNFPTAAGLASSAAGYACLGGCIVYLNAVPCAPGAKPYPFPVPVP
jgi:hypothetical protein